MKNQTNPKQASTSHHDAGRHGAGARWSDKEGHPNQEQNKESNKEANQPVKKQAEKSSSHGR